MKDKVVNQVYASDDYKKFSFMPSNRDLRMDHVRELVESMKKHPLEKPIDVNEDLQIIDGQHRYYAWQELKMPIIYIIHKGWGEEEVPVLNTGQKNWNPSDYVKMYIEQGNNNYARYKEFTDKFGLTHNANLILLLGGSADKRNRDFVNGKFVIKKWDWANVIGRQIAELKQYYSGYKRTAFVGAYVRLSSNSKFDHEILVDKLRYQSRKLVDCTTMDAYYDLLLEIYNYKAREDTRLTKAA